MCRELKEKLKRELTRFVEVNSLCSWTKALAAAMCIVRRIALYFLFNFLFYYLFNFHYLSLVQNYT